jgi:hypothetical protein
MAASELQFSTFDGDDPGGCALAVSINRRHLSKGQRALATAMVYPEPEKTAPGKRAETGKLNLPFPLPSWELTYLKHTSPNLFRRLFAVEFSRQGSNAR